MRDIPQLYRCTGYRNTGVIICKRKKGSVTFQDDMKGKYLAQYFVIVIQILGQLATKVL